MKGDKLFSILKNSKMHSREYLKRPLKNSHNRCAYVTMADCSARCSKRPPMVGYFSISLRNPIRLYLRKLSDVAHTRALKKLLWSFPSSRSCLLSLKHTSMAQRILPDDGRGMKMRISREKCHPLGIFLLASSLDIIVLWLMIVFGKDYDRFFSRSRQCNGCPCYPKPCLDILSEQRLYLLVQLGKTVLFTLISISYLRILKTADYMKIFAYFSDGTDEHRP